MTAPCQAVAMMFPYDITAVHELCYESMQINVKSKPLAAELDWLLSNSMQIEQLVQETELPDFEAR